MKVSIFFHAILKLIEISIWNLVEQDCRAEERSQFSTYCLFSFLTTQYFLQCISQLWLHSTLSLKYKSFNSSCLSLWGINIFCTVPRLCLNMEIFETIGVLFFEKKLDDLEFFQCIKFLKNVSFLNEIVSVAKNFLKVTFRRQNSNQLSQFFKKPFCR